jgi:hypothetical protein
VKQLPPYHRVDQRFASLLDHIPDEHEILFEPDQAYFEQIERVSQFIRPKEDDGFPKKAKHRYLRYQANLRAAIEFYFSATRATRITVNQPIVSIQNQLRQHLKKSLNLSLSSIGNTFSVIVGMGGLSECGKSSFAEHLRSSHDFYRLKLRYFIETILQRGEKPTPEAIVLELLTFLDCHYYARRISVESLHDPYIPAMLKLMFGQRMKIAYIDTDVAVRVRRVAKELDVSREKAAMLVERKDEIKKNRGAKSVATIADLILDNSSDDHDGNLRRFIAQLDLK